jgi:hypothetical protein
MRANHRRGYLAFAFVPLASLLLPGGVPGGQACGFSPDPAAIRAGTAGTVVLALSEEFGRVTRVAVEEESGARVMGFGQPQLTRLRVDVDAGSAVVGTWGLTASGDEGQCAGRLTVSLSDGNGPGTR